MIRDFWCRRVDNDFAHHLGAKRPAMGFSSVNCILVSFRSGRFCYLHRQVQTAFSEVGAPSGAGKDGGATVVTPLLRAGTRSHVAMPQQRRRRPLPEAHLYAAKITGLRTIKSRLFALVTECYLRRGDTPIVPRFAFLRVINCPKRITIISVWVIMPLAVGPSVDTWAPTARGNAPEGHAGGGTPRGWFISLLCAFDRLPFSCQ